MSEPLYTNNRDAYDALAHEYAMKDGRERLDEEVLRLFVRHLPQEALILDLGSGPGQYSRRFADKGFEVVAIDNSAEMINEARRRGLRDGMSVFCMDMRELALDNYRFDAVFALASLIHITREDLPAVLRRLYGLIVPGGTFLASFAISEKGLRHERKSVSEYSTGGRFFQHYPSQEEPRRILEKAGFVLQESYSRVVHPVLSDGSRGRTEWANFIMKKS